MNKKLSLLCITGILALGSMSFSSAQDTKVEPTMMQPIATQSIVGSWAEQGKEWNTMELTQDGKLLHNGQEIASYETLEGNKVKIDNHREEKDVEISYSLENNTLKWGPNLDQTFVKNAKQTPALVGKWLEKGKEWKIMELTQDGKILRNGQDVASYEILEGNKVKIDNHREEKDLEISYSLENNTLKWGPNLDQTFVKDTQQNPALVGKWLEKDKEWNTMELTQDGKLLHNGEEIASYETLEGNKVKIHNPSEKKDLEISYSLENNTLKWGPKLDQTFVKSSEKKSK